MGLFLHRSAWVVCVLILTSLGGQLCIASEEKIMANLPTLVSNYVTIVITVPETHADAIREALGRAGAGKVGNYSHCSYSVKGVGRFMPNEGANPYLGKAGTIEEVMEERIETVCSYIVLEHVIEEVRKAHPYEEPGIDIYPVYEIQRKKARVLNSNQKN